MKRISASRHGCAGVSQNVACDLAVSLFLDMVWTGNGETHQFRNAAKSSDLYNHFTLAGQPSATLCRLSLLGYQSQPLR